MTQDRLCLQHCVEYAVQLWVTRKVQLPRRQIKYKWSPIPFEQTVEMQQQFMLMRRKQLNEGQNILCLPLEGEDIWGLLIFYQEI